MCYPKPGPRCSAHAAIILAKAKRLMVSSRDDFELYFDAQKSLEQAQWDYDITPVGLKVLEEQSLTNSEKKIRLELARQLREDKLSALKGQHNVDHHNDPSRVSVGGVEFTQGQRIDFVEDEDSVYDVLIDDSVGWFGSLTDEELSGVSWMTDFGAMECNTHISGVNDYSRYSVNDIEGRMGVVDSALSKYESAVPGIVYRGVRDGFLPAGLSGARVGSDVKQDYVIEKFPVGSVYENDFYMPTSVLSQEAARFSDFNVMLEIRTSRAAPVTAVSVSTREAEKLIGRNTRFKVHNVMKNVKIGNREFLVVQLDHVD